MGLEERIKKNTVNKFDKIIIMVLEEKN